MVHKMYIRWPDVAQIVNVHDLPDEILEKAYDGTQPTTMTA